MQLFTIYHGKNHTLIIQTYQPGPCVNPLISFTEPISVNVTLHFKLTSSFHWRFQHIFRLNFCYASFFPSAPPGQKPLHWQLRDHCVTATSPFLPHLLWAEHARLQNLPFMAIPSLSRMVLYLSSRAKKKVRAKSMHLQKLFIFP